MALPPAAAYVTAQQMSMLALQAQQMLQRYITLCNLIHCKLPEM